MPGGGARGAGRELQRADQGLTSGVQARAARAPMKRVDEKRTPMMLSSPATVVLRQAAHGARRQCGLQPSPPVAAAGSLAAQPAPLPLLPARGGGRHAHLTCCHPGARTWFRMQSPPAAWSPRASHCTLARGCSYEWGRVPWGVPGHQLGTLLSSTPPQRPASAPQPAAPTHREVAAQAGGQLGAEAGRRQLLLLRAGRCVCG